MKNLFRHWDNLKKELNDKYIMLFLDYDGTLTPIVSTPDRAFISQEVKDLLKKLSKSYACKLAIISGRALNDLKAIVGIEDIIYAGNHGLEIEGLKIKFEIQVMSRLKSVIRRINDNLVTKLSAIQGVFIEDKRLTISVHYRLVDKKDIPVLRSILAEITQPYLMHHKIKINPGKKVYEIRPPVDWDKGKVVMWLLEKQRFAQGVRKIFPIYVGDDVTDEDAFKVIKNKGLGIFVGDRKNSYAQYYLKNTYEVIKFLKQILDIVRN